MFYKIWKIIVEFITIFICNKEKKHRVRLFLRHYWSWLYVKKRAAYFGKNARCGLKMQVTKKTIIKDNASIGSARILGNGNFELGEYTSTGDELLVLTDNHNYNGTKLPYDTTVVEKEVIVGKYCWLGARVTLLPGTTIGDGAIIQAGAVVHGHIPPLAIVGGNPAKVFKYRDSEHYEKLIAEKQFFN